MVKKRMEEATKKRIRAARLLQKGNTPAEIARDVGVARQTVYTWKALFDEGGVDALREVRLRGRPARLDADQLEALRRAILEKPTEHGFGTDLWTLKRVGVVIKRLHGIKYSKTQIWRILGALGFSPQKPDKRALERNEDVVQNWKRNTWPALKKKPGATVD
jgi:transposase